MKDEDPSDNDVKGMMDTSPPPQPIKEDIFLALAGF
jgi:hypothetical protein